MALLNPSEIADNGVVVAFVSGLIGFGIGWGTLREKVSSLSVRVKNIEAKLDTYSLVEFRIKTLEGIVRDELRKSHK